MHISVRGLTEGLHRHTQQVAVSELDLQEQEKCFTGPVGVDYTVEKIGPQVIIRAVVGATVKMACSRCLEPVQIPISEKMTILVRFSTGRFSSGSSNGRSSDGRFYKGIPAEENGEEVKNVPPDVDRVDVTEELRQTLLLALPIKPLCEDDCRGLCPRCGINLNTGSCDCRQKTIDPRWSGLREALKTTQGEDRGSTEKKNLKIQKR